MSRTLHELIIAVALLAVAMPFAPSTLRAQDDEPAAVLDEESLRKMIEDIAEEVAKDVAEEEVEDGYSKGIETFGGAELRLGGKLELNFIDTQVERDTTRGGPTDNPDPHLIFDRLRLEPELDIGRGLEILAQLDFIAEDGESVLKEGVIHHDYDYEWWFESDAQIGIDDNFIHRGPSARLTESYPLVGTAFWRDEEIAFIWNIRIGDKRGEPVEEPDVDRKNAEVWPPRSALTDSTTHRPFDFARNAGELNLTFSIGDGYDLDEKTIHKDDGDLQQILQDDRNVDADGLALRHVGLGISYERDFNYLGEILVRLFYFEDELNDDSVNFLQQNLTLFDDLTNAPLAGYGLSDSDQKHRFGLTVEYHLEGFHLLDRWMNTKPDDGLYLTFQWIDARDGKLDRDGFYVQGSYRFTFQQPLLDERYFRFVEPVIRYGELDADIVNIPSLPLTWDREELVFGAVVGITDRVLFKGEYLMHDETTGAGDVDNDTLLLQLLVNF